MTNFLEKSKTYLENAMNYYYSDEIFKKYYDRVPKSRYMTFKYCYDNFKDKNPVIVELGTTRSYVDGRYFEEIAKSLNNNFTENHQDDTKIMGWDKNNLEKWDWSAGCFTIIFSKLFPNSVINTVDIMERHLNRCKKMNEDQKNIIYHCMASEEYLLNTKERIDLLYLDTGNMDEDTAILHLREAKIIVENNILSEDGIILIDDVRNPYMMINGEPNSLGKSKYSIPYFLENGFEIIIDEYQVILKRKK